MILNIHTDGGSRGNPGNAAAAFVVQDEIGKVIHEHRQYLGTTTNNVAEYMALVSACEWISLFCRTTTVEKAHFQLDSQLVVYQVQGKWKIKHPHLKPFAEKIQHILEGLPFPTLMTAVPRNENVHADRLVNLELDSQK